MDSFNNNSNNNSFNNMSANQNQQPTQNNFGQNPHPQQMQNGYNNQQMQQPYMQNGFNNQGYNNQNQFNNIPVQSQTQQPLNSKESSSSPSGGLIAAILFNVISLALLFAGTFLPVHFPFRSTTLHIIGSAFGFFALLVGVCSIISGASKMRKNTGLGIAAIVLGSITTFLSVISFTIFINCLFLYL